MTNLYMTLEALKEIAKTATSFVVILGEDGLVYTLARARANVGCNGGLSHSWISLDWLYLSRSQSCFSGARVVIAHRAKINVFSPIKGYSSRRLWKFRMLKKIKVVPLAEESFGVRSMCTYVETPDLKILLDAGVSLGPDRFGFPPHPREYETIAECREKIAKAAEEAEVITLSHYHFDHHTPSYMDWFCNWSSPDVAKQIYEGKIVLAKSYREKVNFSQRRRGWLFKKTGGKHAKRLEIADGKAFEFGDTCLEFSEPVFHGIANSPLGWILMTSIEYDGEKILFTSDVQGPMNEIALKTILAEQPHLIIVGGPPTYLGGFRVEEEHIALGMKNLEKIATGIPVVVLEHHLLRDERWKLFSKPIFEAARKSGHSAITAAEFVGEEDNLLESRRKLLFELEPPGTDFEKWIRLPLPKRQLVEPPI